MLIAIGTGYVGGTYLAVYLSRLLFNTLICKFANTKQHVFVVNVSATVFGGLALLPALFLATVVGGNLGGGAGEILFSWLGLEKVGILIGLAAGIIIVIATVVTLASGLGTCLALIMLTLYKRSITKNSS